MYVCMCVCVCVCTFVHVHVCATALVCIHCVCACIMHVRSNTVYVCAEKRDWAVVLGVVRGLVGFGQGDDSCPSPDLGYCQLIEAGGI